MTQQKPREFETCVKYISGERPNTGEPYNAIFNPFRSDASIWSDINNLKIKTFIDIAAVKQLEQVIADLKGQISFWIKEKEETVSIANQHGEMVDSLEQRVKELDSKNSILIGLNKNIDAEWKLIKEKLTAAEAKIAAQEQEIEQYKSAFDHLREANRRLIQWEQANEPYVKICIEYKYQFSAIDKALTEKLEHLTKTEKGEA